eukprot:GHVS01108003.1.p1 GENE.GHVS01108003.1~~GHVS01108003.1.p1  ORF type:complete len:716 (+),score=124.15 GHVS01108003.1:103-2250(+)
MECGLLSVDVVGHKHNEGDGTVDFQVQVIYKMLKWDLYKRFSSFDQLHTDLINAGYVPTCALPAKTILGSSIDKAFVHKRTEKLDQYLKHLISRPDTRSSQEVMDFLKFTEYTSISTDPLKVELLGHAVQANGRMAVSDLHYDDSLQLLAVSLEDTTSLCRLGKVWSLVESERIGCISIQSISGDMLHHANIRKLSESYLTNRCRAIGVSRKHKRVYTGLDDGSVAVLDVPPTEPVAVPTSCLEVHTEAIVCFARYENHILSVALDSSIRLIDTSTNQIKSGGRLAKRLRNGEDMVTSAALCGHYAGRLLALIGSSSGDLLVFRVDSNPPAYIETIQIDKGTIISAIHTHDNTVMVGHGHHVTCWSLKLLGSSKQEQQQQLKLVKRAHFSAPAAIGYDSTVSSLVCDAPARRLVVGYQCGAILVWSLSCGQCVMSVQAHALKVSCIERLAENVYITGSDEGNVKVWHVPADSDSRWQTWSPTNVEQEEVGDDDEAPSLVGSAVGSHGGSIGHRTHTGETAVVASEGDQDAGERRRMHAVAEEEHDSLNGSCSSGTTSGSSNTTVGLPTVIVSRNNSDNSGAAINELLVGGSELFLEEDDDMSFQSNSLPIVGQMWRADNNNNSNGGFCPNNNQTVVLVGDKTDTLLQAERQPGSASRVVSGREMFVDDVEREEGIETKASSRGGSGMLLRPVVGRRDEDDELRDDGDDDLHRAFF